MIASAVKTAATIIGFCTGFFLSTSCTFINKAVNTGLMTKATNKEDDNTIINVMGRYFMNSPMISSQNAKGRKAARVVAVDVMIGQATSPTPSFAALTADLPSCISL